MYHRAQVALDGPSLPRYQAGVKAMDPPMHCQVPLSLTSEL